MRGSAHGKKIDKTTNTVLDEIIDLNEGSQQYSFQTSRGMGEKVFPGEQRGG